MNFTKPTIDEVKQAEGHLVSVTVTGVSAFDEQYNETITGIMSDLVLLGIETAGRTSRYSFNVTSEYLPGTYDQIGQGSLIGSPAGLMVHETEIVDFTDHGARDDFTTTLAQLTAQREHALQALKDAETNLANAYFDVTNLTAQEG